MFGWEFPPHISGGLGTACYGLTKGLMKHGAQILFVVPRAYGDEDQHAVRIINASGVEIDTETKNIQEFWEGFKYIEISSSLVPYVSPEDFEKHVERKREGKVEQKGTGNLMKFEFSGKYGPNLLEEVSRYAMVAAGIAADYEYDVIHAHDWLTYHAGVAAKKISGKPLVVHMHATEFDRSGENINQIVYDIERFGMQEADYVIAVSNLTRNIVIDRYGIDPDKVYTVHNAVEPVGESPAGEQGIAGQPDPAQPATEKALKEKVVTFLGRITYQKGPEYFVEAARKVLDRDDNVRFVMAGSGDMMEKMIRRVAKLGMADKFHFTGFLRGPEVDQMFAMSDVFVMPSVSEPFGIVPLEAMRSNVPVVISKQSGVSEILQHALKVDFWDVDALADSIYGLLQYSGLSETFMKYGKEEVNNLKWENAAAKVMQVYRRAVHV
jgi:glycosyltransferase involved in cell wall biosynthesis